MGKERVKIDGEKFKDGDTVTVVLTGKLRVGQYSYNSDKEVAIEYGDGNEFYLDDAEDGKTKAPKGLVVVKH